MYAPSYGYGSGNTPSLPAFNPNAPPHPPAHPHQQQQQPGQQPQQMMYNPPQYGIGGPQSSPYGGAPGPGMGGTAGGMGMMQNNGMAQMGGGGHGVPTYQTPYSSSPYGAGIPTSSPSNVLPQFMPPSSNAPSFQMNAPNMNPQQHQINRMQPPPNTSTPVQNASARASPFGVVPHNTPPNPASAQAQLSTAQGQNQGHLQTPNNTQQSQSTILTPQTPNFPPGAQGANASSSIASPLSPGSEVREKERVSLLLDINRELLMEVMRLQAAQAETKKEEAKENASSPEGSSGEKEKADKEKAEKQKATSSRDYFECMRRLQSNLAYLAAIADRSHKPSSQIPSHPAIMTPPPLAQKPALNSTTSSPKADQRKESDNKKPEAGEEDRLETLKDQYKRLQALFPGVDPKKEPPMPASNPAARPQGQQQAGQSGQKPPGQGMDQNQQQKLQNDLLRQKMMQAQQAQNAQMAQGMQGMQGMNPQQTQNR